MFNKNSNFVSALRSIIPQGSTALRDSVGIGVQYILQMNKIFAEKGIQRKFLHIVLTDGDDNGSKLSVEDLAKLFVIVGTNIPKQMITTHFIGVDLDQNSQAVKDLRAISFLGLDTSRFHLQSTTEISNIFNKFQYDISVERNTEVAVLATDKVAVCAYRNQYQPQVNIRISSYCVLFNLDISGSMSGQKWNSVCDCIQRFVDSLGKEDLLCAILFNEEVHVLDIDKPNYGLPYNLVKNGQRINTSVQYVQQNKINSSPSQKIQQKNECCNLI